MEILDTDLPFSFNYAEENPMIHDMHWFIQLLWYESESQVTQCVWII